MDISYPLLIDGGLSNELEVQGCDLNHKLWSARLLENSHQPIVDAHLAYLNSGAGCITTASYQATIPGFVALGYDELQAAKFILKSVELAERAKNAFEGPTPYIAASVGPYGAFLADGSEFRGNYDVDDTVLERFHRDRIELLDQSNADFLAFETIPSFQEAKVISKLLEKTQKEAWISFSCKDGEHINDGTPIAECIDFLATHPKIFALGINCTAPQYISKLIRKIKLHCKDKRIVVYPNSGEVYDALTKTWSGISEPEVFVKMAQEWLVQGADILGGCCRIGPDHIRAMASEISY